MIEDNTGENYPFGATLDDGDRARWADDGAFIYKKDGHKYDLVQELPIDWRDFTVVAIGTLMQLEFRESSILIRTRLQTRRMMYCVQVPSDGRPSYSEWDTPEEALKAIRHYYNRNKPSIESEVMSLKKQTDMILDALSIVRERLRNIS
jgi:hypothetical protein